MINDYEGITDPDAGQDPEDSHHAGHTYEDASDIHFGETAISYGSAVEAVPEDQLIISSHGTGYRSPSEFVSGENPYERI
jgi:hypothetical protein